ncbi:MAG: peptidylprolyl isomerase [Myxococcales bacterium]|jgi:peptidyl-prolyl cis-trans isomerase C
MRAAPRSMLVILAASLLAASGCREGGEHRAQVDAVAVVNGVPVTSEVFARELAFVRRTSNGVIPQAEDEQLAFKRAALQDFIDRMLVLAAARDAGILVSAEQVDREILKLKAEYHGSGFNEALAEGQLSQHELRERTRARLITERYFVEEIFAREAVTDPEIEAWYREHPGDFAQLEQVRAAQIVVKTADEARRVQNELKKGMSFDEAARRFSLSPDAKVGGDLGFFTRGVMPAVFDKVCFSLPVGRVSEITSSEYGFHVFKVLEKRPAKQRSLEEVRGEVEQLLLRKKHAEAQKRRIEELRERAKIKIEEEALARVPL